jgi:hypothetical protein
MTKDEMAGRAVELRRTAQRIPDPSMSNYKKVLASYKELLDEMLELQWHVIQSKCK